MSTLQAKDQSTRPRCEATHSPLPWNVDETLIITTGTSPGSPYVADVRFQNGKANAAYIVKACNEYPKLLEALKAARKILAPIVHKMNVRDHFSEKNTLANVIDKAIANAEKSNG